MKKIIYILFIFVIAVFISGCSREKTEYNWTGFYYPDKNNIDDQSTWVVQPGFASLGECQEWVLFDASGNDTGFDYECGLNCRYDKTLKLSVCEKTLK